MPHTGVYARLEKSKIPGAGIGVIAIIDIPKGVYPFLPDNGTIIWINKKQFATQPQKIKKLYADFAIIKGDLYGLYKDKNFNQLDVTWYVNHDSKKPNMAIDKKNKFYALIDINAGEELVIDYGTYSD